jgi:uncharacterized protein YdhG (YjbR/CyaY superfamily)
VQTVLQAVRDTIRAAAPGATESISYQIPTFSIGGRPVVYLAGWKKHLSLYPIPDLDDTWKSRLLLICPVKEPPNSYCRSRFPTS